MHTCSPFLSTLFLFHSSTQLFSHRYISVAFPIFHSKLFQAGQLEVGLSPSLFLLTSTPWLCDHGKFFNLWACHQPNGHNNHSSAQKQEAGVNSSTPFGTYDPVYPPAPTAESIVSLLFAPRQPWPRYPRERPLPPQLFLGGAGRLSNDSLTLFLGNLMVPANQNTLSHGVSLLHLVSRLCK